MPLKQYEHLTERHYILIFVCHEVKDQEAYGD